PAVLVAAPVGGAEVLHVPVLAAGKRHEGLPDEDLACRLGDRRQLYRRAGVAHHHQVGPVAARPRNAAPAARRRAVGTLRLLVAQEQPGPGVLDVRVVGNGPPHVGAIAVPPGTRAEIDLFVPGGLPVELLIVVLDVHHDRDPDLLAVGNAGGGAGLLAGLGED